MKQTMVTGLSGSMVLTQDGAKYPIGNRIFAAGDYAWVHGDAILGHETGGGALLVEVDGIPILSGNSSIFL